jgi:hypothetical protein
MPSSRNEVEVNPPREVSPSAHVHPAHRTPPAVALYQVSKTTMKTKNKFRVVSTGKSSDEVAPLAGGRRLPVVGQQLKLSEIEMTITAMCMMIISMSRRAMSRSIERMCLNIPGGCRGRRRRIYLGVGREGTWLGMRSPAATLGARRRH